MDLLPLHDAGYDDNDWALTGQPLWMVEPGAETFEGIDGVDGLGLEALTTMEDGDGEEEDEDEDRNMADELLGSDQVQLNGGLDGAIEVGSESSQNEDDDDEGSKLPDSAASEGSSIVLDHPPLISATLEKSKLPQPKPTVRSSKHSEEDTIFVDDSRPPFAAIYESPSPPSDEAEFYTPAQGSEMEVDELQRSTSPVTASRLFAPPVESLVDNEAFELAMRGVTMQVVVATKARAKDYLPFTDGDTVDCVLRAFPEEKDGSQRFRVEYEDGRAENVSLITFLCHFGSSCTSPLFPSFL